MNTDKFFDCVGNFAIDPTIEFSASAKTLECLLFILAIFVFYEKTDHPIFFCTNTHLDVVVEIHSSIFHLLTSEHSISCFDEMVIFYDQTIAFLEDTHLGATPAIEGLNTSSELVSLGFLCADGIGQGVASGLLCYHLVHLQVSIPHKGGTHCHGITALRTDIGGGGNDAITTIIEVGELIIEHNLSVTVGAGQIHFIILTFFNREEHISLFTYITTC
jgi:hypothetical protein